MASGLYNKSLKEILDRTLDITTGCKVMLVKAGYTYDPDHDVVDPSVGSNEIVATGYTAGWGGAGRMAATITFEEQDANNRAVVKIANLTWTALGGTTNDTIGAAILVKEGATNDTNTKLIAYLDVTDTPTNGGDVTLSFDATNGNIQITNS
jgi:hypothetical protein